MGYAVVQIGYDEVVERLGLTSNAKIICVAPLTGIDMENGTLSMLMEGSELPPLKYGQPYPHVALQSLLGGSR